MKKLTLAIVFIGMTFFVGCSQTEPSGMKAGKCGGEKSMKCGGEKKASKCGGSKKCA